MLGVSLYGTQEMLDAIVHYQGCGLNTLMGCGDDYTLPMSKNVTDDMRWETIPLIPGMQPGIDCFVGIAHHCHAQLI